MLKSYPVLCQTVNCGKLAQFKVASRWSDGSTKELKTYALCCQNCLKKYYEQARDKQRQCLLTIGETLELPQIFERSTPPIHRADLET